MAFRKECFAVLIAIGLVASAQAAGLGDRQLREADSLGAALSSAEDSLLHDGFVASSDWKVFYAVCSPAGMFEAFRQFERIDSGGSETIYLRVDGSQASGIKLTHVVAQREPMNPRPRALCVAP